MLNKTDTYIEQISRNTQNFHLEVLGFFLRDEEGNGNTAFFCRKQICNRKISNSLNVKYQMGLILRIRHLNLAVCMWGRELISTCSTRLPTRKHPGLWALLLAPSHCTGETRCSCRSRGCFRYARASHLALHAHVWSAFLPVRRRKRKCYFACMFLQHDDEDKSLKNNLGSYFHWP